MYDKNYTDRDAEHFSCNYLRLNKGLLDKEPFIKD